MATFKLTHNGMTRRVQFPDEHPSWPDISNRVEGVFHIPAASVALSYVDADGDTLYINSNDELFDMFHTESTVPKTNRFTVHDIRQSKGKGRDGDESPDDGESSSSSSSSSVSDVNGVPDLADRRPSQSTGIGLGGMGIGFAPFEMMFGPAATAASVKSPSQGHISPMPTGSDFGAVAAEAGLGASQGTGLGRSQYGRSVASSVISGHGGNPAIHIQQPSTDADAQSVNYAPSNYAPSNYAQSVNYQHEEPGHVAHPTPALYEDVAHFIHALSGAVATHPAVSIGFARLLDNAHSGAYWDEHPQAPDVQQAAAHNLLGAINSLLHTFFPPPPPRTPTQAAATPAYTAAQYELPDSVIADETPVPSRLNTPSVAPVPVPEMGSPAMSATSVPSTIQGPRIQFDVAHADRASVRSYTDAGSVVSSGMGSPIREQAPSWQFAGRTGHAPAPISTGWNLGAVVTSQPPAAPEPAKYVESRVKLEHMKEMYKQTKEEYRREREERKREREARKHNRMITAPEPLIPPASGGMFDKLNQALAQVPGRVGLEPDMARKGIVPPAAPSVAASVITNETAVRSRQQLTNWLVEQLGDMGFSAATHPQVSRMVRDATRPYAASTENVNENALLDDLLAQLVPTTSKI